MPPETRSRRAREAPPPAQRPRLTRAGSRVDAPTRGRSGKVNEDVETRFQHLASSVQNDVMQLNGAMEASLDYMYGKDYAAASSSRILNTSDEAVEPSSRHDGHNTLGTYKDGQDNCTSTGHDESGTATNPEAAADRDEGTDQGDQAAGQHKRQRKPRRRNMLGTDRIVINRVSEAGLPVSPKKAKQGYRNALGCILRETVSINETNLRSKANGNLRALLISKLHTHYKFPDVSLNETTLVNNRALCKWSKLLSSWKSKAKNEYLKKDYETEIKKMWPSVSEEDWNLFKQHCETPEVKEMEKWGKDMRAKNIGNHTLGSRGYPGKKPKWDKQDTEFTAAGDYPVMVLETRSRRAHASETALPSPQRPQLTHAGSRGNAPTSGRSGQVNEDVESRFQHLASSVQNDVMQLKATTREDEGGTHTQDVVAVVPRMTRKRAREACASETALPSLQHTRLTRNGSKGEAPTSGCSDQVNKDVESRFRHLASSVQNDVMQLEAATGEDGGGARIQDLVTIVTRMTRRAAREACASETALVSLQRIRLTRGGSRGEAPTSGRSDMSGNDSDAASSSRTISAGDEAVEPSPRHGDPDALGTFMDGQDDYTSTVHDESGTATNPADATDRDEGTGQGDQEAGQPKKQRKPRRRNMLGTNRIVINRVSEAGLPLSPKKAERGYSNGLGCILRETVSINETNLRSKANENLRALLISKLHTHYKFPDESLDETTPVNNRALCKWSKVLSTWKSKAKSEYLEKDYITEIKKKWPSVSEEDWNLFKQHCKTPEVKEMEKWGKDMRARNIGNHTLGSRGYPGKKPKWDKQDAEFAAAGIPNPFKEFENPRENDYIRSRCKYDEETKTWVLDEKTMKVKELLRQYHVESQSSQESESSARWDDPLNRSINVVLGRDPKTRPASGRVNGVGVNEKWDTHYPEDRELARQRRRASRASFESRLAGMREELKEEMREEIEVKAKAMATAQVMEMWPDLIEAVKQSLASGQTAPPPSAVTLAPANVILEKEPRPGAHHSSHSVCFMG
ncbi:uncharacterized protein LOC123413585 isoform X2 [Hordeum vulgare subsp. vulgare]|uniref:uncharacterized protein LOC123413585 isoform X2 n=1 Tax=Hordeum vulgare subsp. vulgare TaxID=112509 RepID=UPI001D1A4887|nr:uncharacterized protein LOC123413585 isoform X2 [Hordeum vulgare subsp. vulgare]